MGEEGYGQGSVRTRVPLGDAHETVRLRVGQRPEQHTVGDGEEGDVRTDAEGEGEEHGQGVAAVAAEAPQGLDEIQAEGVHPSASPP